MTDFLEYQGYQGSVEFSADDGILFGKILFIDSLILYHGESVESLKEAFHSAVDEYVAHCVKNQKEPNKPYSGSFNVRIGPDIHRAAVQQAYKLGQKLNEFVKQAIEKSLSEQLVKSQELTINHVVRHVHQVETSYSMQEPSWQPQASVKSKLRVVSH